MTEKVPKRIQQEVRERAGQMCEYCLIHEEDSFLPHEVDHVIAVKHGGGSSIENLAWSCFVCNRHKGSDLSSIDPVTGKLVRLFNPRSDTWIEHFDLDSNGSIVPKSDVARVTEFLLKLNSPEQIEIRRLLFNFRKRPK
jgi:5-methylcytosine-specific restriction endonuclease McrA